MPKTACPPLTMSLQQNHLRQVPSQKSIVSYQSHVHSNVYFGQLYKHPFRLKIEPRCGNVSYTVLSVGIQLLCHQERVGLAGFRPQMERTYLI